MKKHVMILGFAVLLVAGNPSGSWAQQATFKELLERLLPDMGRERIEERRDSQQQFQNACFSLGAPGKEAGRAEACKMIAEKLGPQTAKPARLWLLKQLEHIGRGECVDAIAALLDDPDGEVRECARRALEANPAPQANAKLLAKLQSAEDSRWRVALVNAIGARRDRASVPALIRLLGDREQTVVAAAAGAVGEIGGEEAARALAEAAEKVPSALVAQVADAAMRCADGLLKQGKQDQALAVYRQFDQPEMPRRVRLAALQGILQASGEKATPMVAELLAANDRDLRAIAAGYVENLLGRGAMKTSAADLGKLPPAGQVLLLSALAAQGDKKTVGIAVAGAKSGNRDVRVAGLRALGKLGDASTVPLLIEAFSSGGPAAAAAKESLQQVFGNGVDEAVVAAMKDAEVSLRGALIEVLGQRKAPRAVPALIEQLGHEDAGIRSQTWNALGSLAEPGQLRALIPLLLKTEKGLQREQAERALGLIAGRTEPPQARAAPVLEAMSKASPAERSTLLPLAGRVGGPEVRRAVQDAMRSDQPELREAGVRALCNWPDASVAEELFQMAQASDSSTYRQWALRAYVRVVGLPSDRPPRQTLAMFQKAMQLAARDEERRLILARAAEARDAETVRWLVPYLENPALRDDAARTIVDLARRRELMQPNRDEFTAALRKVVEACKDQAVVDRAQSALRAK